MDQRNFTYMFYGFTVAWLAVVAYIILLTTRENRLRREMDRLRGMIADREGKR